jgi:hypothetical protein
VKTPAIAALLLCSFVAFPSAAAAQPVFDHLACYQIKDAPRRARVTADLVPQTPPFLAAVGCKIKLPAREYCTSVAKENIQPTPPVPVGGGAVGDFLCYSVSCPRDADLGGVGLDATDQIGARTIFLRKPKRLCMPVLRPTPTPTPTGPTPTSTFPTPSPTPTGGGGHDPGCSFDGTECQGFCRTANKCLWHPTQERCVCPEFFDVDCDHTIELTCTGGLCYGPNQQCGPKPVPSGWPCGCFPKPSPTPP